VLSKPFKPSIHASWVMSSKDIVRWLLVDDIGDLHLVSCEPGLRQALVEELTGLPYERLTGLLLFSSIVSSYD